MNLQRFVELLDQRGAVLESWPAEERASAERLLADAPEARSALEEASALERELSSFQAAEPRPELRASVAAIPERHPRLGALWPFATYYRPMLAMAAATLLGIGVGNWAFSGSALELAGPTELSASDFDELSALAFAEEGGDPFDGVSFDGVSDAAAGDEGAP